MAASSSLLDSDSDSDVSSTSSSLSLSWSPPQNLDIAAGRAAQHTAVERGTSGRGRSRLAASLVRRQRRPARILAASPSPSPLAAHDMRLQTTSAVGQRLPGPLHATCAYLDYNATTPIFPEVAAAMEPFLWEHFGNASSTHVFARPCRDALALARGRVASLVHARDAAEVFFSSCGTECDHWAIASAVGASQAALPHVIASCIEHPAVLAYLHAQAARGVLCYSLVPVQADGTVLASAVVEAVTPDTCLVTLMHSNNEIGALQPVAEVASLLRSSAPRVLLHTDAAQSCGKVRVDVQALGVDYATVVGHKLGAPKGVAALYVRAGAPLGRMLHGGGQEGGYRAGTENVLHIVALGAACSLAEAEADALHAHMTRLRDTLQTRLVSLLGGEDGADVRVHGPSEPHRRLPNTLSIGLRGVCAAKLLHALRDQVAASAGAACHSESAQATVSAVLKAMGVAMEYAVGTLRLSVGRHTTEEEVERAVEAIVREAARQRAAGE